MPLLQHENILLLLRGWFKITFTVHGWKGKFDLRAITPSLEQGRSELARERFADRETVSSSPSVGTRRNLVSYFYGPGVNTE